LLICFYIYFFGVRFVSDTALCRDATMWRLLATIQPLIALILFAVIWDLLLGSRDTMTRLSPVWYPLRVLTRLVGLTFRRPMNRATLTNLCKSLPNLRYCVGLAKNYTCGWMLCGSQRCSDLHQPADDGRQANDRHHRQVVIFKKAIHGVLLKDKVTPCTGSRQSGSPFRVDDQTGLIMENEPV